MTDWYGSVEDPLPQGRTHSVQCSLHSRAPLGIQPRSGTHGSCTVVWLLPSPILLPCFYAGPPQSTLFTNLHLREPEGPELSQHPRAMPQPGKEIMHQRLQVAVDRQKGRNQGRYARQEEQTGDSPNGCVTKDLRPKEQTHHHYRESVHRRATRTLWYETGNDRKNHQSGEGNQLDSFKCYFLGIQADYLRKEAG